MEFLEKLVSMSFFIWKTQKVSVNVFLDTKKQCLL